MLTVLRGKCDLKDTEPRRNKNLHHLKYTKSIDNRVFSLYLFDVWVQDEAVLIWPIDGRFLGG